MEVTKEIPPQVRVRHFQARIYYEGMINKCFICKSADHIKANCPRRNATQNSSSVQGRLYSDIVEARDLRPSFAKRVEDKQLECQMTVLKKQSGAAESQQEPCGSGTDTVGLSGEAISVVDVPRVQPALVSEAQESSPRISASGSEQRELTEPVSDESTRQEEPFIEQKVKKRGRKKTRGERGESSNESESEPVIIVPASVSLLDAQQVRTRSRSKQPRIAQDPLSPPSTVHKKHNQPPSTSAYRRSTYHVSMAIFHVGCRSGTHSRPWSTPMRTYQQSPNCNICCSHSKGKRRNPSNPSKSKPTITLALGTLCSRDTTTVGFSSVNCSGHSTICQR